MSNFAMQTVTVFNNGNCYKFGICDGKKAADLLHLFLAFVSTPH